LMGGFDCSGAEPLFPDWDSEPLTFSSLNLLTRIRVVSQNLTIAPQVRLVKFVVTRDLWSAGGSKLSIKMWGLTLDRSHVAIYWSAAGFG
jgi:hypothetical protein